MRITIIGLGLIGGSAALAWKQAHAEGRFHGGRHESRDALARP